MEKYDSGTGRNRRSQYKDPFIDLVFSWSTSDIFDEDLYKNQVEDISETFESVDHYLGSYVFPLLEETRAELASAMETLYEAPFAKIKSLTESKRGTYNVKVDQWEKSDRAKEAYKTLPGDIVLVSNMKPETASDLERAGWTFTLACVRELLDDGSDDESRTMSSHYFNVKTAEPVEAEDWQSQTNCVVFLMNVTTQKRIWNVLGMRRNMRIIEKVISKDDLVEENCDFCPSKCDGEMEEIVNPSLSSMLNESQLEAVFASLSKIDCQHKPSVELIWGPPGTGKTKIVSVLLYTLLKINVRTLVCAPTNVAIRELASRVLMLVQDSIKTDSENDFLSYPLGDMLIFGNEDRLKVGSDIEEIYLDYRVDRLVECLASFTGWKHCVSSMLDFLENCVSQHQIFVENEQMKEKENSQEKEVLQYEPKSLLEFARDRFLQLAPPLRECMLTFLTHLPRSFIHDQTYKNIEQLMLALGSIEMLLFEDNGSMMCNELESIFTENLITSDSEPFLDTLSLKHARNECISFLGSVQVSLGRLDLPNIRILTDKYPVTEFCFQKASLIFCTTSSSFKLHKVDIEPFSLLVIDEAAQVKECESIIPLQIPDVRHAILVGDEKQLPATVHSKLSEGAGFGRSMFARLSSLGHSKHLLNVQYRMHPSISQFPNSSFYHNQILDAPSVQSQTYEKRYLQGTMFGPYSFINVHGGKEELDDAGRSRRNMVEVAVVVKLLQKLFKAWNVSNENLSIGVISPYAAQVAAIRYRIRRKYENHKGFIVKVNSVDGFQGGEEDIIIISTVRSNKGGSIGFLASPQRTNVALTRARHCLWILGNGGTLSRSDSVWEALVCDAKHRKCFFNADDDRDFGKTIIDVKEELDQLDDLLSGECILFKNSRWKVLLSENFRKSFQKLKSSNFKKLVINLLLKIASGWRPKNVNVDCTCKSSAYIVKQFKVEKYYVVCSVDIIKDSIYLQVLKVWDILPMSETSKLLKRLDGIFAMYTDDFINHCNINLLEGNLEIPMSWSTSDDIIRFKNSNNTANCSTTESDEAVNCRNYVENSKVNESLLLMKFYSLSSGTVNHLLTDLEGREVDLPFEVTDEEREIIMFPRSSFILGRSGTGKTTILTMKLVQKFQQYTVASQDSISEGLGESSGNILRQIFVTVSPKLCYAVKKHVSQLQSFSTDNYPGNKFTDMDDIDEMTEFRDIPDALVGIEFEKYPLVITFHKFLMMLDGSLSNSYFERFREVRGLSQCEGRRSIALTTSVRRSEVTYDRFRSFYWPHFNAKLIKNLDPSRVFTEIMSHIKGCLQVGETNDSKRSRQEYVGLSDSRISTLSSKKRDVIYDIFEEYEKMKLERGEFDLADFVIDIHHRLKNENLLGDKMDFVYIDEVQDLTMSQISLFKYICKNVEEGFVFCGDTAQTIARGIDFRFEDIRSLFYNEFLMKSGNCEFRGRGEKGLMSDIFCLSQNFRTHTGVLRLAQSVIDVICYFFPQSIDVLPPETSLIYGESPVVLEPGSDENQIMTIFGHSGKAGGKWVGFGADQVILVRDDFVKKEVSNFIGHQALVLTIVECKGLEFQDVLLYNFFGSSPLGNQWRAVYEFLQEKDLLDVDSQSFPAFNQSKHNILCSELKQLYVAITRTRQRLWICENNKELCKPMLDYWKRLCLVQVRKIDDSLAEAMQRASSPEEWKSQGIKLFWEKNYKMATLCFEKAGDETWEKRAKASGLRSSADTLRVSNPEEARVMLREAAEIYDSIGRTESAAECFCDLGEYERAGNIYLKCGGSELRKAGECFSLAGIYKIAAEVYSNGNFFDECLSACTKGNYYNLGLKYIEQWKQEASRRSGVIRKFNEIDKTAQDFLEKVALECHRKKDNASLIKFVRAFNTIETKRNFLKSLDCVEELLIVEEEAGNFNEAAEIAKRLGYTLREADLLEKAGDYTNASLLVVSYVLWNSLWLSGSKNQGWPLKSFPQKEELLAKAKSVAQKVSVSFHLSICAEANAVMTHEQKLSEIMEFYSALKEYNTYIGEVLSVRKLLDAHLQLHMTKYEWDLDFHADPVLYNDRISKNQVSCRTLVYLWNLWNEKILEILDCLDSLENGSEGIIRFCLAYFGVRMTNNPSATYILLKPDAAWIGIYKKFIVQNRKVATLDAHHFASSAQKYMRQELVSTGFRVLEALQALHRFSVTKPLSKYCESLCLICLYDVTRFFIESDSLDMKKSDDRKLQNFLNLSMIKYLELVFPLDPRQCLSENLIRLRETELSKNLLDEIISSNICGAQSELTYGQIGRVLMIMLGSGKPKNDLYTRFVERLCVNSAWKPLVVILFPVTVDLSFELYQALEETYNADWMGKIDYISPNCFFYLVERLLILVPHPQGFFFTTKSSFVEHLMCLQSDADLSSAFVEDDQFYPRKLVDFIFGVVHQCLYDNLGTLAWIKNSCIDVMYYLPVLMLRLIVILCSLCLNRYISFNVLFQTLDTPQIRTQLPRGFCEALSRRNKNKNVSNAAIIAAAFKAIGDPLLIVSLTGAYPKPVSPDAICVNLRLFSCTKEILNVLFPSVVSNVPVTESSSTVVPIVRNQSATTDLSSEYGKGNVQMKWVLIREVLEALESYKKKNNENLKGLFLKKKVEVENHVIIMISQLCERVRSYSGEEDKNELFEATGCLIEELNHICSLLAVRDVNFKGLSKIGELLSGLEAKRSQLDALLSQLTAQPEPNVESVASEETDENKISENAQTEPNVENVAAEGMDDDKTSDGVPLAEDKKSEDLPAAASVSGKKVSNQGKGKKNKNKKSKKELEQLADHLSGVCIFFRNSRWKVLLSENFIKSFQKLKPSNIKKLVINKLLELASGRRPKNMNVDRTCESSAYIVKQLKVKKFYVVCSVDIIIKDSTYLQVLKVWDILPMAETPELLKRLDDIFTIYTDDFINQCNTKLLERKLEIPKSWSTSNDLIRFKNSNNTVSSSTIRSDGAVDLREYERVGNIYLECCGGSELRKAGECFLDECLSACTKGNYVDISLQYIEQWKQQASQSSGVITKVNEIEKNAQDFLEKIALECHRKKDNTSLMKFVRAFNTIESKRNFLKSLDCVEALLILEEESGNFNEAAGIEKRLGDTLHKIDLLETSGDYTNASLLVISYVLCNSLWLSGSNNQGWPLKSFPQKDELLTKAKLFAHKVSGSFHLSICAEANAVMTHEHMKLSELMEFYSASKEYNTYMGEILSVRKLLDAHLQVNLTEYEWDLELHTGPVLFNERISRNKVSCRTLTYVWYLWKVKILEILDCLDSLENRFEGIVRFCHDFFGVIRLTNNPSAAYILLKPDAVWVRTVKKFIVRNKKVAILDARHFSSAAQKYLRQELVSTGFRVLEALHSLSVTKPLSKYCQSLCLFCVYDVTRFFIESKSLDIKKGNDLKLKDFLKLSMTKYFELVFPLDPRESLSEKLILFRETEMSKNLLDEIISRNIHGTQNELTFGQIGRVVMIMLGSGKPKHDLYVRIVERLGANSPWKQLVANLFSVTCSVDLSRALQETYDTNWRGKIDCISPNCFFYLVERLLILVPHPQGYFFTTKSSFVEHLICQQLDADPSDTFVIDDKLYAQNLVDFLVDVVHQSLHSTRETMEWIQNSRIDGKYYFPIIMLRLIVILCTLCLNSYVPFDVLFQMLETPQIRSQLPTEFYEAFSRINKNKDSSYVSAIAGAFKVIGDPLVIVSLTGARPKDVAPDAVYVDLRLFSCRNEVVNVLFRPEKIEDSSAAANGNNVSNQGQGENRPISKFTIKASSVCCVSFLFSWLPVRCME
ncbi:hypothetical protein CASFOL_022090 [Castilleja foliolosa]|uniref:UvrD-like helicase ATP-binding domain-containing protein n=1 Tax=Castilleja foliolosa TaxID=1961234 RepID=A0ABD3D1Y4_9LAMI